MSKTDIRNNYLELEKINGVDLKTFTYNRPTDALNPKEKIRNQVLTLMEQASSPDDFPPIEVKLGNSGKFDIVDGEHRVHAHLAKLKSTKDQVWSKIKTYKTSPKSQLEYKARSVVLSLSENDGKLDDQETFKAVSYLLANSNSAEEVINLLGPQNTRIVNMVNKIVNEGVEEVAKQVIEGNLSIDTASKITKKPAGEQAVTAKVASGMKKNGVADKDVNKALGLRKNRSKLVSVKEAKEYALVIFEAFDTGYQEWVDQRDDTNARPLSDFIDDDIATKFEVVSFFFGLENYTVDACLEHFRELEGDSN